MLLWVDGTARLLVRNLLVLSLLELYPLRRALIDYLKVILFGKLGIDILLIPKGLIYNLVLVMCANTTTWGSVSSFGWLTATDIGTLWLNLMVQF